MILKKSIVKAIKSYPSHVMLMVRDMAVYVLLKELQRLVSELCINLWLMEYLTFKPIALPVKIKASSQRYKLEDVPVKTSYLSSLVILIILVIVTAEGAQTLWRGCMYIPGVPQHVVPPPNM